MVSGFLLSANMVLLALFLGFLIWLGTIPYHAQMALVLCTVTISASIIVPLAPGRLQVYEAAALLSWSGVLVTFALRRYAPDSGEMFKRNFLIFAGVLIYLGALLLIMRYRGVGFQLFGGGQAGGRRYFQQLECAVLPLLFVLLLPGERLLFRLFIWQSILTLSYLIAEFALVAIGSKMYWLLIVFDLPYDGINFAVQRLSGGIERYQSLQIIAQAALTVLFVYFRLEDFTTRKGWYLIPLFLGILALGSMSGHRYMMYVAASLLFFLGIAQKFFTVLRVFFFGLTGLLLIGSAYLVGERLPNAVQRTLYILPAFPANGVVVADANATFEGRRAVRELAMDVSPEYRWVGRGFSSFSGSTAEIVDPLEFHLRVGIFYNGMLSLLINTGLPGTVGGVLLLLGGCICSWRIFRYLWAYGPHDNFARLSCVMACMWFGTTFSFIFLEGTAEHILRYHALQAGFLLACERNLLRRHHALKEARSTAQEPSMGLVPQPA